MAQKSLPFTKTQIEAIIAKYPTPFHIYNEKAIRENARNLNAAFSWAPGFKEYFAVKATPNPAILQVVKEEGFGADCSSLTELLLAERTGITGENIMFTSNDTPAEEFRKAVALGAIINLDDITHIAALEATAGILDLFSL
jgi:diaminopimelate decarboxylase